MAEVVIDTNVLLVANGAHDEVSYSCVEACIEHLTLARTNVVVVDDEHRILSEYKNKLQPNGGKGVGDAFLKWLLQNSAKTERVVQVTLTDMHDACFVEFPDHSMQSDFDPADRKFVAVANACAPKAVIWQATDCKWLDWWQGLEVAGISVKFICPDDVCRFYAATFPRQPMPALP